MDVFTSNKNVWDRSEFDWNVTVVDRKRIYLSLKAGLLAVSTDARSASYKLWNVTLCAFIVSHVVEPNVTILVSLPNLQKNSVDILKKSWYKNYI